MITDSRASKWKYYKIRRHEYYLNMGINLQKYAKTTVRSPIDFYNTCKFSYVPRRSNLQRHYSHHQQKDMSIDQLRSPILGIFYLFLTDD